MATSPQRARRLEGRKVLITGGASGIGRATAILFAAEGAKVALLDRDGPGMAETARAIGAQTQTVTETIDLFLTPGNVAGAVERAAKAMGGIDGVVNAAGIADSGPLESMDLEMWSRVIGTNLTGPYLVCRAALPFLKQAKDSSIVNISSAQALVPFGGNATAYSAAKGGVLGFSACLAAELGGSVRVNSVCPGMTNTPMTQHIFKEYGSPSDAPFVQLYTMKRVAEASEIAAGILFLISSESSYVTGITLAVDGGRSFH